MVQSAHYIHDSDVSSKLLQTRNIIYMTIKSHWKT